MSLAAAKATGLVVVNAGQDAAGPDSCVAAHWKGQSDDTWMFFNGEYGLRALDSFGDQKTPEGIKPGSTLAAVRRAYPHLTWRIDGEETPDARRTRGDALVDVVKGDGAHYRINIKNARSPTCSWKAIEPAATNDIPGTRLATTSWRSPRTNAHGCGVTLQDVHRRHCDLGRAGR